MFIIQPFLELVNHCRSQKKASCDKNDFKNIPVCDNPSCPGGLLPRQKLKRCSRCKKTQYCSINCQRLHWKHGHSRKCNVGGTKKNQTDDHMPEDKRKNKENAKLPIYRLTEKEAIDKFPHAKDAIQKASKEKKKEKEKEKEKENSKNEPSYEEVIQFVSHNVPILRKFWRKERKEHGSGVLVIKVPGKFSLKAKVEDNDLSFLKKSKLQEFCPIVFGIDKDSRIVLAGKPILKKMKKLCKKNVGVTLDQLEFYSSRARKITSQLKAILKEHHKNEDMVIFAVIGKFSVSPVGQFPIR